jgi:hypothetical protein
VGEVPGTDAPWGQISSYAKTYDAYERWVGDLGQLSEMLRPIHEDFQISGEIAPNLGEDLLRAWLFVLVRQARFVGVMNDEGVVVDDFKDPAITAILGRLRELTKQTGIDGS